MNIGEPVMRAWTRRAILAVVVVVPVGLALWGRYDEEIVYDGWYPLTVHLTCPDSEIRGVVGSPFMDREKADAAMDQFRSLPADDPLKMLSGGTFTVLADPFDGRPLKVNCVQSGRIRYSQREHRRRARYLLVVADLADGRRVFKMADIPDPEVSMEITVTLG